MPDTPHTDEPLNEPWRGSVDWWDACRPDYCRFSDEVTDDQLVFLQRHDLTFDEESTDYDVRQTLLGKLERLQRETDAEDDPEGAQELDDLMRLVTSVLCPVDCNSCAEDEIEMLFDDFVEHARSHEEAHPDVLWVLTDARGEVLKLEVIPDQKALERAYFDRHASYRTVKVTSPAEDAFAEIAFENSSFRLWAVTDPVEKILVRHAEDVAGLENADLEPMLLASPQLRHLMADLLQRHAEVRMPERLRVTRRGETRTERTCGFLDGADLAELFAVAKPLVGMREAELDVALALLPDADENWQHMVAAIAAA